MRRKRSRRKSITTVDKLNNHSNIIDNNNINNNHNNIINQQAILRETLATTKDTRTLQTKSSHGGMIMRPSKPPTFGTALCG